MDAEQARELQIKIIELCHASAELGMDEERIKRALIRHAYGVDDETLRRMLKYLQGEKLLAVKEEDRLRPDIRRWVSTSEGDKLLMKEGLI